MSTQILSDKNVEVASAKVVARAKPYTDLDLKFKPHPNFGDVVPTKDLVAIKNSVKNIVLTGYGERPFQPTFGSRVTQFMFENPDPITISLIKDEIINAIKRFEPRVAVQRVDVEDRSDNNAIFVSISVLVLSRQEIVDVELFLERTR